ncbi:FHA domain-containing protein [Selenihalanaerobacter shriftii]|uniref:FHA domain-containing protein n=1 Tax=Selenihalanaerobacter shriftii TaxID=142842 RepID=A0A1T4Q1F6_9FIRM|nr:FHA domain-containing protein [Selenihalanaerobacter shriftii]SJZ97613.1 FHA domain-containing protein [Selenihalanaerobacter shriftii]
MKMERCQSGHLYNPKKYKQCPYCDEQNLEGNMGAKQEKKTSTVSDTNKNGVKTLAYWDNQDGINPVVGWLVCIDGAQRGKDYRILSEKNFIGRSEDMHIYIKGDNAISRRNHAVISYNPKRRHFMLIPGAETTGIIYVNEEAIYAPTELSPYDVVGMGNSEFIFIPLCGQHFEWENDL